MNLFESFLKNYPLSSHHVDSFDEWQYFSMIKTLKQQVLFSKTRKWEICDAKLEKPKITHQEAQLKNLTYESNLVVTFREIRHDNLSSILIPNVIIGQIPIIVRPEETHQDCPGGFFVIKGKQRILVTQIREGYNQQIVKMVRPDLKNSVIKGEVANFSDVYLAQLSCRSISEASGHSCNSEFWMTKLKQVHLVCPIKFRGKLNVGLVLKALGCETRQDFEWATGCIETAKELWLSSLTAANRQEAIEQISKLKLSQKTVQGKSLNERETINFLLREIWPHLGFDSNEAIVSLYIGRSCAKLYRAIKTGKFDNRDSLKFKRFESSGQLIGELFEQICKRLISTIQPYCYKKDNLISALHETQFITKRLLYCFSTGTWGALLSDYKRLGVSQMRSCTSWLGALSHLQRVSNPISRKTKNQPVRQLDASFKMFICASESPEGHTSGLVNNLALSTRISHFTSPVLILNAISHLIHKIEFGKKIDYLIFVNGKPVGHTASFEIFYKTFCQLRFDGWFDRDRTCSIGLVDDSIYIWTDAGRLVRPVWTSEPFNVTDWNFAWHNNMVQMIDHFELEHAGPFDSKRELDYCLMHGVTTSLIPFSNFQPVARCTIGASINKQSVSCVGPDVSERFETTVYQSRVNDISLVRTVQHDLLKIDNYPTGNTILVAICPFDGYNQEDAVVVNRQSVERGLFMSDMTKVHQAEESCDGHAITKIERPPLNVRDPMSNYCLLDMYGMAKVGSEIKQGDVIIGMTSKSNGKIVDISIVAERGEGGKVVRVVQTENNGYRIVKVIVKTEQKLEAGDKMSSLFGQKGIVGKIVNCWEMPFTSDGTVPDMIISPLCLPSRMTLPTIIEGLAGLVAILKNEPIVVKCFDKRVDYFKLLKDLNYPFDGAVEMYHPKTCNKLKAKIFLAPMYYQKIAHFASQKCYARDLGVMSKLTRQPTDGRSRQGGLRFGEMERDAVVTMPSVLDDRLFWSSDAFWIPVCKECGKTSVNKKICLCGSKNISVVKMGFSNHLTFNLIKAMGCKVLFNIDKSDERNEKEILETDETIEEVELSDDETSKKSDESNSESSDSETSDETEDVDMDNDIDIEEFE